MMEQRYNMECEIQKDLERCIKNIKNGGKYELPRIRIRREDLWLGNKIHFEEMGFRFEEEVCCEKEHFDYYVWLIPSCSGNIANEIHKQLCQAQRDYVMFQRKKINDKINQMKLEKRSKICIRINVKKLCFDNKIFFEEKGFVLKKDLESEDYVFMMKM